MTTASTLLRQARSVAGVTTRDLARAAGSAQPRVTEIEHLTMVTLDRDDISTALDELLDVLVSEQATAHIRIVGGAALWISFGRNETTADVDALYGSSDTVENAARAIARRRGCPDDWLNDWLNDKVKMFATRFDNIDDWGDVRRPRRCRDPDRRCSPAPGHEARRRQRTAGLHRHRPLLDECSIRTVDEARRIFERFYPEEILPERAVRQLQVRFPDLDV